MKYLILILSTLSLTSFAQTSAECSSGQYFDASLNRCILSTQTVDTKTDTNNCGGLSGEAQAACYKNIVNNEVTNIENKGIVGKEKGPKASYAIPTIATLGVAYLLFTKRSSLGKCGKVSLGLMAGAGATTLLGELITNKSYSSKLKKLQKRYEESIAEKSTDTNADLDRINSNQINAFNFQIEQEQARETAHKSRRNIYGIATALYTGAAVAALWEAIFSPTPCKVANLSISGDSHNIASISTPKMFNQYSFIPNLSQQELVEVMMRKIFNAIIPSANAVEPAASSIAGPEEAFASSIEGPPEAFSKSFRQQFDSVTRSAPFRAAFSGLLAGYSVSVAKKASEYAKEAKGRAKAIEEIRDGFLANGGAGLTNCTEQDRSLPSKPTCYCYESGGSRRADRASSPTCSAVFGAAASAIPGSTDYGLTGTTGSTFSTTGCLSNTGVLDQQCQCQKTNTCSSISGNINLGSLGNISGLTSALSTASDFTNGRIGSADIDAASLQRNIANINKASEDFQANPKIKDVASKADEIGLRLQESFGNSIQQALKNPANAADIASVLGGSLGSTNDKEDQVVINKPSDFKAGQKSKSVGTSVSPLKSGASSGVSIDDYNFGAKKTGGIKVEDGATNLAEGKFKIDDISDNTDASIFTIISNRYQTTGMRSLFKDEDEK